MAHRHSGRHRRRRNGAQLLASGEIDRGQLYAAAIVLARLQDRQTGHDLTIEDMCEILGYLRKPEPANAAS